MTKRLDFHEKIVCNKVGKMFAYAAEKCEFYEVNFCKAWLGSDVCNSVGDMDETIICQSHVYLFNNLIKETDIIKHEGYIMDKDVMYWIGYICTYMSFARNIKSEEILKLYDIKQMMENYDTLHTLSSNYTVELIESDYCLA